MSNRYLNDHFIDFDNSTFGALTGLGTRKSAEGHFDELAKGATAMAGALCDIGGVKAVEDAIRSHGIFHDVIKEYDCYSLHNATEQHTALYDSARTNVSETVLRDCADQMALASSTGIADRIRYTDITVEEAQMQSLGVISKRFIDEVFGSQRAVSRATDDMTMHHRSFAGHADMFSEMRRSIEAMVALSDNVINHVPEIHSLCTSLGSDTSSALGLNSSIESHFQAIHSQLENHSSTLDFAQATASAALGLSSSDSLQDLLARSLARHEALEQEALANPHDANRLARIQVRLAFLDLLVSIITLAIVIHFSLAAAEDSDEAIEALKDNTAATIAHTAAIEAQTSAMEAHTSVFANMQKSLNVMAEQLETLEHTDETDLELTREAARLFGDLAIEENEVARNPVTNCADSFSPL
ncbi:hypothetical protein ACG74X_06825 [Marivita sp. S0852]|uniref:hypothetical protein n=1 Tax=Marivita sp. S0852 TaxID=3373893 RepID=UPI003981DFDC